MVKTKELPQELREEIISLHLKGSGYKKISKNLNVSKTTIGSIVRKFQAYGAAANLPGRGRKPKISNKCLRNLIRKTKKNPFISLKDLQDDLMKAGTYVSVTTIRRSLNNQITKTNQITKHMPLLTKQHNKGLEYARTNLEKSPEFWGTVLWSDVTKMELFNHMDREFVWCSTSNNETKRDSRSVMMWGCFSAAGTGNLYRVTGIIDSHKYQAILRKNVLPSVEKLNLRDNWTFLHENDPKYNSKSTKAWLKNQTWNILERPSLCPDLNPTESLWCHLKKAVASRKPSNLNELEAFAREEWTRIPQERCQELVSMYRNSLIAFVEGNG